MLGKIAELISGTKMHPGASKLVLDSKYLYSVIYAVNKSQEILILGPSPAKLELIKYAHKHNAQVEEMIVGLETVDQPSDKEILEHARKFFYKVDQMI